MPYGYFFLSLIVNSLYIIVLKGNILIGLFKCLSHHLLYGNSTIKEFSNDKFTTCSEREKNCSEMKFEERIFDQVLPKSTCLQILVVSSFVADVYDFKGFSHAVKENLILDSFFFTFSKSWRSFSFVPT